jgi:hypothetical protein
MHINRFGELGNDEDLSDEEMAEMLLVEKTFTITRDTLHKDIPVKLSTNELTFRPDGIKMVGDKLFVFIPSHNMEGSIVSTHFQYNDKVATYMSLTAFIHWEVINGKLSKHYDILAYPDEGSTSRGLMSL